MIYVLFPLIPIYIGVGIAGTALTHFNSFLASLA